MIMRLRGQTKEKGGAPGSARQEVFAMETVAGSKGASKSIRKITDPNAMYGVQQIRVARLDEFELCLENGQRAAEPFAVPLTITPELAQRLLGRNPDNRALKLNRIRDYAKDMAAGRFDGLNGETIKISRDGLLNDGQNRLQAVIESGKPLRTLVVFGTSRDSRMTIDAGGVRSSPDYAFMSGISTKSDARHFAAVANTCHAYDNNALRGTTTGNKKNLHGNVRLNSVGVTKSELLDYGRVNQAGIAEALEAVGRKDLNILGGRGRIAAAYFIIRRRNPMSKDVVDSFFANLISGEGLAKGNPILALRRRLLDDKTYGHPSHFATLQVIIKAWNAHVNGEDVQRFNVTHVMPDVEIA